MIVRNLSVLCGLITTAASAHPATAKAERPQNVFISVKNENYSGNLGYRRSVAAGFSFVLPKTTVVLSPTLGVRKTGSSRVTAVGAEATIYKTWSKRFSTRSRIFASQNRPVFAKLDVSQDFTVQTQRNTAITVGARTARFAGGEHVNFGSLGVRQYFKGGSVSYRLSLVDTNSRPAFISHLVSMSFKDPQGTGRTVLWLSAGDSSFSRPQFGLEPRGKDLSAVIQRMQPLGDGLSLSITAGLSSYARPNRNVIGTIFGVGITRNLAGARGQS